MSIGAVESAEKVLYKQFKYRAVNPLEHQLRCLDVIVKIEQSLLDKAKFKISSDRMRPLMRLGSMIEKDLMATESTWYSEDAELERMREGLEDLENVLMPRSFFSDFKKKKLISTFKMSFSSSKRVALWLSSVAGIDLGIDLGFGESLSCTMGGLTSTSVDYTKICTWVEEGSWKPKISFMQKICSEWEKPDRSGKTKKLWIVTEVLYATSFVVTGRKGLFGKVMVQNPLVGVPGLAAADFTVEYKNDSTLELKAKRNKCFIVGYRTMRVEYNPDGTVKRYRKAEDTGLRGDDDDLSRLCLEAMGEDIFEVDDDGDTVPIPLLTPTKQELSDLKSLVVDSSGSEAAPATI